VQGAGVGGSSLVYRTLDQAKDELFNQGWPPEITVKELRPYYDRVGAMLNVQKLPENQATRRFEIMREGAGKLGYGDRFQPLDLAVTFDPTWSYDLPDPHNYAHSKSWTNNQGVEQGTCVHCGNCDLGCPTGARNTLDLNYIPRAEKYGAEVRPLHLVDCITPVEGGGYRVDFKRIKDGALVSGYEVARRVIVAAGSIGSTELLLRCRDQHKSLPQLSPFLGCNWSSNGDFLTPAFHDPKHRISPTRGPTITSAINFLDGMVDNQQFFIEDGGFPPVLNNYLQEHLQRRHANPLVEAIFVLLREKLGESEFATAIRSVTPCPGFPKASIPRTATFICAARGLLPGVVTWTSSGTSNARNTSSKRSSECTKRLPRPLAATRSCRQHGRFLKISSRRIRSVAVTWESAPKTE
jgi:cholesterol oxidase